MYLKKQIGNLGEELATNYLKQNNYNIVKRNFKCRQGEIDIIAKDIKSKELVFIEVKTRTNYNYGCPSDAVDENKKKHIYKCTEYYVYKNNIYNIPIRFDVIEINQIKEKYYINQIKNAFYEYKK